MRPEPQIDTDTGALLPPKRQMARVAAFILLGSLIGGLLIGFFMFKAPDHPLALYLGNLFMTEGSAAFKAPGGALLAFGAGLAWTASFALLSAFPYIGWLIYRATSGYNDQMTQQKLAAYTRARPEK